MLSRVFPILIVFISFFGQGCGSNMLSPTAPSSTDTVSEPIQAPISVPTVASPKMESCTKDDLQMALDADDFQMNQTFLPGDRVRIKVKNVSTTKICQLVYSTWKRNSGKDFWNQSLVDWLPYTLQPGEEKMFGGEAGIKNAECYQDDISNGQTRPENAHDLYALRWQIGGRCDSGTPPAPPTPKQPKPPTTPTPPVPPSAPVPPTTPPVEPPPVPPVPPTMPPQVPPTQPPPTTPPVPSVCAGPFTYKGVNPFTLPNAGVSTELDYVQANVSPLLTSSIKTEMESQSWVSDGNYAVVIAKYGTSYWLYTNVVTGQVINPEGKKDISHISRFTCK